MFNLFGKKKSQPDKHVQALETNIEKAMRAHADRILPELRLNPQFSKLVGHIETFCSGHHLSKVVKRLASAFQDIRHDGRGQTLEVEDANFSVIASAFCTDSVPRAASTFDSGYLEWVYMKTQTKLEKGDLRPMFHWIVFLPQDGRLTKVHLSVLDPPVEFFALDLLTPNEMRTIGPDTRPPEVQRQWREWSTEHIQ